MIAQKKRHALVIGLVLIFTGAVIVWSGIRAALSPDQYMYTPKKRIIVERVTSKDDKRIGLSKYTELADDRGMLFVFEQQSREHCFWMKDMQFAIDMIWLDAEKKVVTVTENVAPKTFPESFCPDAPALYGLEVSAGNAAKLGVEAGVVLRF